MRERAFMLHRATRGALLTLALATASACATTPARRATPEPCPGDVQLVVRNNTGYPIDIYRNAVGRPFVATVQPGTAHLPIAAQEQGSGYLVFTTPGVGQTAQYMGFSRTSEHRFQVEERCLPGT